MEHDGWQHGTIEGAPYKQAEMSDICPKCGCEWYHHEGRTSCPSCGYSPLKQAINAPQDVLNTPQGNTVQHPNHYTVRGVECMEIIRQFLGDKFPAFCEGNALKYLYRYRAKNGVEDLRKADQYINELIHYLEAHEDDINKRAGSKLERALQ